ncbi:isoprenylcysteine carboxylmethyltransferase family protein [Corynebacterium sp.]|uniref:methyltransferase family protein n=1 Tax=Corynebacterium sp. TaxID=1720 RepID=UPI0026E04C98|nr:isoprenylcysteine carboxylmethyltransferase family protein [Corynebacterium sp.]MDO5512549.1 isoprenylcysteine carboxylmethyltransferase family protein [Corynebacterium sp.]
MRIPPAGLFLLAAGSQRAFGRLTTPGLIAAAPIVLGSAVVGAAAVGGFLRQGTTVDPVRVGRASSLVTDGVFAVTRNPMYLALAGTLTAHAVARGSGWGLIPVAGFVTALNRWQIAAEEKALERRFGAEYAAYAARVPRWLGLVGAG